MKNNLLNIFLSLMVWVVMIAPGQCTQLPDAVVGFIKQKFPEANIRFDGLIELPDQTQYLPVLPSVYKELSTTIQVVQTIPASTDFSKLPDMILFNNNLALLKIIKKENEPPTVLTSPQMPLIVKLGILPQDLVVPRGLVLSPELKVLLGDLKIPLKEKYDKEGEISFYNKVNTKKQSAEKNVSLSGKTAENVYNLPELEFLKGKKIYAINYRTNKLNILNSQTGRTIKTMTLSSVPFDMEVTPDEKYLLLTAPNAGKLLVIDIQKDEFVKSIDIGNYPTSIAPLLSTQKAYITNKNASEITEIELNNMQVEKKIPVKGFPDNITVSEDENFLYYNDSRSGNVYSVNVQTMAVNLLYQDTNVSRIRQFGRYLYSLSRTENTLSVFDTKNNALIKKLSVKSKPVDVNFEEKTSNLLVLSAGDDEIQVVDTENFEVKNNIPMNNNGFPSRIKLIRGKAGIYRGLVADNDAYQIVLYDTNLEKIIGYIPVADVISEIIIVEQ